MVELSQKQIIQNCQEEQNIEKVKIIGIAQWDPINSCTGTCSGLDQY